MLTQEQVEKILLETDPVRNSRTLAFGAAMANAAYAAGIATASANEKERNKPRYYAGVTVWEGNKTVTLVSTKEQCENALENPLLYLATECLYQMTGRKLKEQK